jgi:cytochrome oxidase Cu insertion factor (SCO1/SenC/PrrC family)
LKVGTVLDGAAAPAFALRNQVGAAVNLQQMRGHVVVLTILDATCTAECPVTAQYLDWTGQFLGKDVQNVGWMAMSVNPSNTKEDAETFLNKNSVQAPLHILMGGEEKLAPLWKAYHIVVQPDEDGDVQHSLGLYVIEAQGREREWDTVDATITS